jgi:hypothetical protein
MTELQMGLMGLGIVAVAGVLAYNKWQETRHRQQIEEMLSVGHPDILFGRETQKAEAPPEASVPPPPPGKTTLAAPRIEPILRVDPNAQACAQKEDSCLFSPEVDLVATIDVAAPVSAQRVVKLTEEALSRIRKPLRWIGFDEESAQWRPISGQDEGEYRRIRAGLQLVDRHGSVSGDELAFFSAVMNKLAEQLPGRLGLPPWQEALGVAADLDQFCASVDIQVGINVISQKQAFAGTQLRALAESAGMSLDGRGGFVRSEENQTLFTLLNQDAQGFSDETMSSMSTPAITFLLDVPCVACGEGAFDQMLGLAQHFAGVLHGVLVDDHRHPLSASALEPIRQQIGQYQALMAARQLPAGSPLARRLFS